MTCWHEIISKDGTHTGKLAKCASDPCPIPCHQGTDIKADTIEQAYEHFNARNDGIGMHNRNKTEYRTVYYGVFFNRDKFFEEINQHINREPLENEIRKPHITFGFNQEPEPEFGHGKPMRNIQIIGYANDGVNEGVLVRIPENKRKYYHGAETMHITLSTSRNGKPVDTAKLDFKPVKPFTVDCGKEGMIRKPLKRKQLQDKSRFGKPLQPAWKQGEPIERRHFNGAVASVNSTITDDDWKHLQAMTDRMMNSIQNERDQGKIENKILSYLKSDDDNAVRFRAYCGKDVRMEDMAALISNNVGAMTRRFEYGSEKSVRRCLLSNTANDMNKKRYIASVMFFGGRCCYCSKPLIKNSGSGRQAANAATGEHLDPLDGNPPGETKFGNMALCCHKCNNDKANQPLKSWIHKTRMLTDEQRHTATLGIQSFRDFAMYERMDPMKAKTVNEAVKRLEKMKHDGVPADDIRKELAVETMRIQQA